jgi:hypothetical protein
MVLPRGIPAVVTLKIVDVPDIEEVNVVGEPRLELVDQTAVYVTVAAPMPEPSVYVVTAFHESVSACAVKEKTTVQRTKAIDRRMIFVLMNASVCWFK